MFTKYCDDCGYKCKTEEERDMWCNGCNEASDEQMLAFDEAM